MKVLHLDSGLGWRGGQQQISYLASGMARFPQVEQFFVLPPASPLKTKVEELNLACYPLPLRSEADPVSLSGLARLTRRLQPDLLHSHDARTLGLAAILRALGAAKRIVAHRRVEFPIRKNLFSKWKYREVPSELIAVSQHIRTRLAEFGVKQDKISVVYDGVELTDVRPSIDRDQVRGNLGMDKEALVLGCIGHFTAEKGHGDLIRAFAQIHEGHSNARLLLVGDGPLKDQYRHLIHKLNLGQNVILAGIASDLREFLAAMDIFVFPSVSEGLGSVLLMAMANRLPVAASRVGGIPEIVIDGQTGFLFPPGDSISLAKCVLLAIDDRLRLRHCAENAAERVREHFSTTRMVEETYRIYSNVLSR